MIVTRNGPCTSVRLAVNILIVLGPRATGSKTEERLNDPNFLNGIVEDQQKTVRISSLFNAARVSLLFFAELLKVHNSFEFTKKCEL